MSANLREHAPSPRRLQRAREDGKTWQSPDMQAGAGMLVGFGALLIAGPWLFTKSLQYLSATLRGPWPALGGRLTPGPLLAHAVFAALGAALPLPFAVMTITVLVGFATHRFRVPGRFRLNTPILNPVQSAGRLFGRAAFFDLLRRMATLLSLVAVAALAAASQSGTFIALAGVPAVALAPELAHLLWPVWFYTAGALAAWGGVDAILQSRRYQESLRMTTQEVRDEQRETQGDPLWRHRRRSAAQERLRRSARPVRDAAVVVVNPTHAAVALEWTPGQDAAPTVAAKGLDDTAAAIRAVAAESGVPIVSNPPLTWQLMSVPIGDPIPEDSWHAVAIVLAQLLRRRQALAADDAKGPPRP